MVAEKWKYNKYVLFFIGVDVSTFIVESLYFDVEIEMFLELLSE